MKLHTIHASKAGRKPIIWLGILALAAFTWVVFNPFNTGASSSPFPEVATTTTPLTNDGEGIVHFETTATACPPQSLTSLKSKKQLKSQSQEDELLLKYFNGMCGGTYAEMGALDGIVFSNSYVFNAAFGWKGLLVELTPPNVAQLVKNRQNELAVVHAGVCDEPRLLHYTDQKGAVSGIWEFMSAEFRETWHKDKKLDDMTEITCQPLQGIIDEQIVAVHDEYKSGVVFFDFWSLDIEGAEMEALHSIDWSRTGFGVILAERDGAGARKNAIVQTFLERQGYIFLGEEARSLWFINPRFDEIYIDFLHQ